MNRESIPGNKGGFTQIMPKIILYGVKLKFNFWFFFNKYLGNNLF